MNDILIRSARLASGERVCLRVAGGSIACISETISPRPGEEVLDAREALLLPGAFDMHVHGRVPGGEHKEDYEHLIAAALAGGVTGLAVMPNTSPPLETSELVRQQVSLAKEVAPAFRLFVNVGVTGKDWRRLRESLDDPAVVAIKMYESATTGTEAMGDEASARRVLEIAREADVPVMVHAQDESMIESERARLGKAAQVRDHAVIQTLECELVAVRRYLRLARETGARVTICHISAADTVEEIAEHNARYGKQVYTETAPHYWRLDLDALAQERGTLFQMNPSLREPEQKVRLARMLLDPDLIDYVATDHAPHTLEEKLRPYGEAPSGIPGVQTSLPLLWDTGLQLGMTPARFAQLTSSRVAEIYRIPHVGSIAVGEPADLIFFDTSSKQVIRSSEMKSKCAWTPYDGVEVTGRVVRTLLRGHTVFEARATSGD